MESRPFKLLNASERAWLEGVASRAASGWLAEWLPGAALGAVRCRDASECASGRLVHEPLHALERDVHRLLARRLFGTEAPSVLIGDVARAALPKLVQRVFGLDGAGPAAAHPDAACCQRGSGAAVIEIAIDDRVLALLAEPRWVQRQLAARPRAKPAMRAPPIDPRQCIGRAGVQVQAWAGTAWLELGLLQTLAAGDVIRLDARIDEPLPITVHGHETGRGASLGSADGRRALQFAARR